MKTLDHPRSDRLDQRLPVRLFELRSRRSWSLEDLALATGMARATLSRIERGETSPTANQLGKLCTAYQLTMSRLLTGIEHEATDIIPLCSQAVWLDPGTGFQRRAVSPPAQGLDVELVECLLPPSACVSYEAPPVGGMEQQIWIMDGALEFSHDGAACRLETGDCLRLRLWGTTRFTALDSQAVRYLVCVTRQG